MQCHAMLHLLHLPMNPVTDFQTVQTIIQFNQYKSAAQQHSAAHSITIYGQRAIECSHHRQH
jgi:hypothetical protein